MTDIFKRKWYVIPDDVIGGWAVAAVDRPMSLIKAGDDVAQMLSRDVAEHIVAIHNRQLEQVRG